MQDIVVGPEVYCEGYLVAKSRGPRGNMLPLRLEQANVRVAGIIPRRASAGRGAGRKFRDDEAPIAGTGGARAGAPAFVEP